MLAASEALAKEVSLTTSKVRHSGKGGAFQRGEADGFTALVGKRGRGGGGPAGGFNGAAR
jgi:hypothetical protein